MADLDHNWGGDLVINPTGDLSVVDDPMVGRQRVLRRLLTNPGSYIWQTGYGAGLGQFVGSPAATLAIKAVIRSQVLRESAVSTKPEPVIEVFAVNSSQVYVQVRYTDATASQPTLLSFNVGL